MATKDPVVLDDSWTKVFEGLFTGTIQNTGNYPVVAIIAAIEGGEPDEGAGGFPVYAQAQQISITALEAIWCRAAGPEGGVVLN